MPTKTSVVLFALRKHNVYLLQMKLWLYYLSSKRQKHLFSKEICRNRVYVCRIFSLGTISRSTMKRKISAKLQTVLLDCYMTKVGSKYRQEQAILRFSEYVCQSKLYNIFIAMITTCCKPFDRDLIEQQVTKRTHYLFLRLQYMRGNENYRKCFKIGC